VCRVDVEERLLGRAAPVKPVRRGREAVGARRRLESGNMLRKVSVLGQEAAFLFVDLRRR